LRRLSTAEEVTRHSPAIAAGAASLTAVLCRACMVEAIDWEMRIP
jgi:hypothetical protein